MGHFIFRIYPKSGPECNIYFFYYILSEDKRRNLQLSLQPVPLTAQVILFLGQHFSLDPFLSLSLTHIPSFLLCWSLHQGFYSNLAKSPLFLNISSQNFQPHRSLETIYDSDSVQLQTSWTCPFPGNHSLPKFWVSSMWPKTKQRVEGRKKTRKKWKEREKSP